jgi:putative transposase
MKTNKPHEVDFRRKRNPKQGFGFDSKSLEDAFIFSRREYKAFFYSSEAFNVNMEGCRIIKESGRWFVTIPEEISIKKPDNQRLGAVALDPGVRTFISYYSSTCHGKLGESDFARIYRLCSRIDKAISKMAKADYRSKKRIRKAVFRLRWKIRDLIDEIHHKIAYFLVTNFDTVYIPFFETSHMVTKLRSKTSRAMLTWAHYRFKEFLKFKGKEYSCNVIEVGEEYTSKTCSYCGTIHNIGSRKIMKCSCGANVDRDLNGARGIYIKNFTLYEFHGR